MLKNPIRNKITHPIPCKELQKMSEGSNFRVKIFQRDSRSLCNSRIFNMKSVAADTNCTTD